MSKKNKPADTQIENDQAVVTEGETVSPHPDPEAPKSARELRSIADEKKAEYDALVMQVRDSQKKGLLLEKELIEEVKAKVKAHAGDTGKLMDDKRRAYTEYEKAARAAKDAEEREAVT
ncbi:MAG: hypothetical protein QM754_18530 [Tepidisphaeraceae bacterium]